MYKCILAVKLGVPPLVVVFIAPSFVVLQLVGVTVPVIVSSAGLISVSNSVAIQPFPSVTVTL